MYKQTNQGHLVRTEIKRWGNSLAMRLPKAAIEDAGFQNDQQLELTVLKGKIVIEPVKDHQFDLAGLLAQITPENLQAEIQTDPLGEEIW